MSTTDEFVPRAQIMNTNINTPDAKSGDILPWYKQFWPWFIIALPASVVVASFFTLWLAISNPYQLVVDETEYRELKGGLKAQPQVEEKKEVEADKPESQP
jgi:hypothetical protein